MGAGFSEGMKTARAARILFGVALLASAALLLHYRLDIGFVADDWAFLRDRSLGGLDSLLIPENENIVILQGHGGTENKKAVDDAVDMFLRRNLPYRHVRIAVVPFTKLTSLLDEAFADKDFHAGYMETSLMLFWHPELVRDRSKWVTDSPELMELFRQDQDAYQVREKPVEHELVFPVITQHPDIEVGVMGDPSKSSAEYGERFVDDCVANIVELIQRLERA